MNYTEQRYRSFLMAILAMLLIGLNVSAGKMPVFLEGVWQAENKNIFEKWEVDGTNGLNGESFTLERGTKQVTAELKIEKEGLNWVYTATVLGENDGKGVEFVLNHDDKGDSYSFENLTHDFPKQIIYKKINDNKIFVEVLGDEDRKFSHNMLKTVDPKVIHKWFLDDLEKTVGTWVADNRKNMSEQDKHTDYGFDYVWGIGKTSVVGTMYGMIDGQRTQDLWTFRHYWDNEAEKAIVVQYGLWGQIGRGEMKPIGNNQIQSIQTFSIPDTRTWEVKHIIEMHDTHFISTQYNKDKNGDWVINGGAFKWVKQNNTEAK